MRRRVFALAIAATILVAAGHAWAEPIGRLFFTPERRAALERQRQLNIQETRTLEGSTVSLDGIVTRSSGKTTIWVNQRPQTENASGTGVTAAVSPKDPTRAVVTPGEEPPASLKVGESINRATRERSSALDGGTVVVKPPAPGK